MKAKLLAALDINQLKIKLDDNKKIQSIIIYDKSWEDKLLPAMQEGLLLIHNNKKHWQLFKDTVDKFLFSEDSNYSEKLVGIFEKPVGLELRKFDEKLEPYYKACGVYEGRYKTRIEKQYNLRLALLVLLAITIVHISEEKNDEQKKLFNRWAPGIIPKVHQLPPQPRRITDSHLFSWGSFVPFFIGAMKFSTVIYPLYHSIINHWRLATDEKFSTGAKWRGIAGRFILVLIISPIVMVVTAVTLPLVIIEVTLRGIEIGVKGIAKLVNACLERSEDKKEQNKISSAGSEISKEEKTSGETRTADMTPADSLTTSEENPETPHGNPIFSKDALYQAGQVPDVLTEGKQPNNATPTQESGTSNHHTPQ